MEVNPVDPPGALRRVGARRKLELVSVGGGSTERLNSRRPSQACGRSRGKARKHQRWHMASWPNNGGKRPTAGWRPTESEWSISHRPELAASVASGPRARRLVHSDPLNEPDHVIDVRNPLAKSASPRSRHPMAQSWAPASLVDVPPNCSTALAALVMKVRRPLWLDAPLKPRSR